LQQYAWPGNVRELRNVLERVCVETAAEVISYKAFEEWQRERAQFSPGAWDLQARRGALAARPVLITPYHGATPVSQPLLPDLQRVPMPIDLQRTSVNDLGPEEWAYVDHGAGTAPRGSGALTRERMQQAYAQSGGNITQAAKFLGVHKATFYRHMKAMGLTREDLDANALYSGAAAHGQ
jgi:DNA-binding NtrC family response regulator